MKYFSSFGDTFESEEEAREYARSDMGIDDYASYLESYLSYEDLLRWAFNQNLFLIDYEDAIAKAEEDYFHDWYEEDDEDEEEEEDF